MKVAQYLELKEKLINMGYADEIEWAQTVEPPTMPEQFVAEYIWVLCNSGMKNQIARQIFNRIIDALPDKMPSEVFGHKGKAKAMEYVLANQTMIFNAYQVAEDKLAYLGGLPWIGGITKYHLAKNLGLDCVKPDRHLVRVANHYGTTPDELCRMLALQTGDRIGTVDLVIWRACNLGLLSVGGYVNESRAA